MATKTLTAENFDEVTRGDGIVLVDFWASWCGPCKASFPVMDELYRKYSKDGLVIVAVNLDDKRELMDGTAPIAWKRCTPPRQH